MDENREPLRLKFGKNGQKGIFDLPIVSDQRLSRPVDIFALCAQLHDLPDVTEVDLSQLQKCHGTQDDWDQLSEHLLPLLIRETLQKVVLEPRLYPILLGKVRGRLLELLNVTLGEIVRVNGQTFKLRGVVSERFLVCKLVPKDDTSPDDLTTIRTLNGLNKRQHIPYGLARAVVTAYKCLSRKNRLDRRVKSQAALEDTKTLPMCRTSRSPSQSRTDSMEVRPASSMAVKPEAINVPSAGPDTLYHYSPPLKRCRLETIGFHSQSHHVKCYICKERYDTKPNPNQELEAEQVHMQYPRLCPKCARFNWAKRHQRADLEGKYALVTGGRLKIGYEVVLKLLRDGARVIATTRFPHDAARRYVQESDHEDWSYRLKIYPLDLKDLQGIYRFVKYVGSVVPHLDILINNAAQTIRRPIQFYRHLLDWEHTPRCQLKEAERDLLAVEETLSYHFPKCNIVNAALGAGQSGSFSELEMPLKLTGTCQNAVESQDAMDSRGLAVTTRFSAPWSELNDLFPSGQVDSDGQQVDLRPTNSWRSVLNTVPLGELLEVLAVNTVAPFVLNKELKALMTKSPAPRKFIVNVSAMEGQFSRGAKTEFHPHTNMAKAALNMMTRTAALSYVNDNIYMTSVDTGWVTDERPHDQAQQQQERGFVLPLDNVDGAARVYDPIATGLKCPQEPHYAVFLKNYRRYAW